MRKAPTRVRGMLFLGMVAALAACASGNRNRDDLLRVTLYDYESAVRWSRFDAAAEFLDPTGEGSRRPSSIDMQRYEQIQVTGYYESPGALDDENRYRQSVEIRFVNRHTQAERSVVDRQVWRFDAEAKRWWLTTGLPDLTAR